MKVLLMVGVLILVVVALVLWFGMPKGPSYQEVAHLEDPRIVAIPPQKVLLVRATGDPNEIGGDAFGLLMKTYFKLKGVPKSGPDFKPPRARWPVGEGIPKSEWEGLYAVPVPETVTSIPQVREGDGHTVELVEWDYGEVAEILHVGRYDEEPPTVERLEAFVMEEGYEISGMHEEEYLKGPGLLFGGTPDRYLTVIRYPVRKRETGGAEARE